MRAWMVLLLLVPTLSGCLSFLNDDEEVDPLGPASIGYDPESITISSVEQHNFEVTTFDNVTLSALVYEPRTRDALPNGESPEWPIALFMHPWRGTKTSYTNWEMGGETVDLMQQMAESGILAASYDARGWGQSGGEVTIAGPAEIADIDYVLDEVERRFATTDNIGVVGESYGGGQSLLALSQKDRIDTAVSVSAWSDVYDAIMPNNVPKGEWIALLLATGEAETGGRMSEEVLAWIPDATQRTNIDSLQAQLALRSSRDDLTRTDKPMFQCQGLQDSLFHQALETMQAHAGFSRTRVYTGGHGTHDASCWEHGMKWLKHFVGGRDMNVDEWPAWVSVDADGSNAIEFDTYPTTLDHTFYLRSPDLTASPYNRTVFEVQQQLASNPTNEPTGLWDYADSPFNAIPEQFRDDPTSVFFATAPFEEAQVLMGQSDVTLHVDGNASEFQVTASLYHVQEGSSRLLGRAAAAEVESVDEVTFSFPYVKAIMDPGSTIVLRIGANDASMYMQYPGDYTVAFTGDSSITLPFFA